MSKKRADLNPLNCVNLPVCFSSLSLRLSLCLRFTKRSRSHVPSSSECVLCASWLAHASASPRYRCLDEIGRERRETKTWKMLNSLRLEENSFWNLGPKNGCLKRTDAASILSGFTQSSGVLVLILTRLWLLFLSQKTLAALFIFISVHQSNYFVWNDEVY